MIAIDTNILVYAHQRRSKQHGAAVNALRRAEQHPVGWGVPLACIAEFWRVVTKLGSGSNGQAAHRFLEDMVAGGAVMWLPGAGFWDRLAVHAIQHNVTGDHIFDLQIALIAVENGAREVWSHDANFVTVPGLRLRDPLVSLP